jgi:uncharacterized membrane protein
MAKDLTDKLRSTAGDVARDALKNVGNGGFKSKLNPLPSRKSSPLSGAKGVAAGAGLAALAPLAKKGVDAVRSGKEGPGIGSQLGEKVGEKVKETVSQKVDEAGGAGGIAKQAASGLLGLGGGGDGGGDGAEGVGKGRRMPVQQSCDVAVPVETAYNQFTQFEEWPNFMHRVTRVTQEDDCTVSFASKIWGVTKEFQADIETQRPDERIKWRVSQGITHTGVVTFHELAPRLTRIELTLDVAPGSLIEKFARGARHVKRAARADLHRFKAFIEMQEQETGAWRGRIEDGELVEEHPEDYDQDREYSEVEEPQAAGQQEEQEQEQGTEEGDKDSQRARKQRFERQARASSSGRSRSRSSASGRGDDGSAGGGSKSRSGSSGSRSRSSGGQQRKKSSNRS